MAKRGLWLLAVLSVAPAGVLAAWLVEGWGGGFATRSADDIGLLGFAVFGAVCSFLAARRSSGRQRATWLAMAGGLGAWSAGEVVWCYYELWRGLPQTPFPSPADAAYLLFPVGRPCVDALPRRSRRSVPVPAGPR
ncbi:MAG TPA: hypothetical protein VEP73_03800, partial [Actinomycetota bacterium]|nr:hypothetical protein [Actinomycetota bacterium]